MANTFKNAFAENVSNTSTPTDVLTAPTGNDSRCVLIGVQLSILLLLRSQRRLVYVITAHLVMTLLF